jgi:CRP/FNR family cyclic AMP-dependent transcriptional regulator
MKARYKPFIVTAETLCGIDIFAGLETAERARIAKYCGGRRFEAKQQILSQSDGDCEAFFIVGGAVKIAVYSDSGKEVIFREVGPGRMFGELSAIDCQQRSAHVHALSDTAVAVLSSEKFRKVTSEHPLVAGRVMQYLCGLVRSLSIRVFEHDALSVNSRVHAELLRLAQENMVDSNRAEISPTPTHVEFAAHIGTHREAVTKELNKMRKMGLVERMGRTLVVHDVTAIEHLTQSDCAA